MHYGTIVFSPQPSPFPSYSCSAPIVWIRNGPNWASFPVLLYFIHLAIGENGTTVEKDNKPDESKFEKNNKSDKGASGKDEQPDKNGPNKNDESDESNINKAWGLQEVFAEVCKVLPGLSKLCNVVFLPDGKHGITLSPSSLSFFFSFYFNIYFCFHFKIKNIDYILEENCEFDTRPKVQPTRTDKDLDLPLSANWQAV